MIGEEEDHASANLCEGFKSIIQDPCFVFGAEKKIYRYVICKFRALDYRDDCNNLHHNLVVDVESIMRHKGAKQS